MTDVDNVLMGPAGSPDYIRRNERSTADQDKFKEEMMRKMSQVNESDPEQQKKRKQQAEEEEEEAVPEPEPTPPSQVTPFDLQKQVNPMDLEGGGKTSPLASAQPTEASPAPQTSSFMAAAPEGTQADFGDAESASIFNVPQQAEAEPQTSYQQPPTAQAPQEAPQAPAQQPAAQPQISPQGPAQTVEQPVVQQQQQMQQATSAQTAEQQQQQQQQQTQTQTEGTLTRKPLLPAPKGAPGPKTPSDEEGGTEPMQPEEEIGKPSSSEMLQKGVTAQELDKMQLGPKEETSGLFEQMTQQGTTEKQISPQKKAEELAATDAEGLVSPTPVLTPTEGSFEGDQGHKKKEEDLSTATADLSMPTPQLTIGADVPIAEPSPAPGYTAMNSQVFDLFERMVGVMTIMTDSKMTETVITLNAPQFASSVFYGTQIIIQEYASAPKAFNIQLNGNPEAVALFQGNADDLMAAFQYGNYNFRVNRLETGYLAERPLFHRKEKASDDKQDQSGPGP